MFDLTSWGLRNCDTYLSRASEALSSTSDGAVTSIVTIDRDLVMR
ncbi:hypothetical protein [Bacteroides caecimuris]|nr:hypothetical protein [Bacteroides caecimuris]